MTRIIILSLTFSLLGISAYATGYEVAGALTEKTLTLNLKEKEATAPGCDLYVQKFEYYPDYKFINLVLAEVKNCPLDNIAARSARWDWQVPFNFSAVKSVFLKVNRRAVGTLEIQGQNIIFKPRGN